MSDLVFPFHHGVRLVEPDDGSGGGSGGDDGEETLEYGTLEILMTWKTGGAALFAAVKYNGTGYGLQSGVISGTQWYENSSGPQMISEYYNNVANTYRFCSVRLNLTALLGLGTLPPTIEFYVVRWYPAETEPYHDVSITVSRQETAFASSFMGVEPQDITYEAPGGKFSGYQFTIDVQKFIRNQIPFIG